MKKNMFLVSIILSMLVSLMIFLFVFEPLCVKTISDSYINSYISNRVIDLVIDQDVALTQTALSTIKEELENSRELYTLNLDAFHSAVHEIIGGKAVDVECSLHEFSASALTIIKDEVGCVVEKNKIEEIIIESKYWHKLTNQLRNRLPVFVFYIYHLLQSFYLKLIVGLLIIVYLVFVMQKHSLKIYAFVCLSTSLIQFVMAILLAGIQPLCMYLLNVQTFNIPYYLPLGISFVCILLAAGLICVEKKTH